MVNLKAKKDPNLGIFCVTNFAALTCRAGKSPLPRSRGRIKHLPGYRRPTLTDVRAECVAPQQERQLALLLL